MDENDRLKMYEAQAIALEKEQELEKSRKELEEAKKEIERLVVASQKQNFKEAITAIERSFNAKFAEINQKIENVLHQFSNQQSENDKKFAVLNEKISRFSSTQINGINSVIPAVYEQKLVQSHSTNDKFTSALLLGGKLNDITDSICIYNSKGNKWINCRIRLPNKLHGHGSALLNGEVFIFGGFDGKNVFKYTYKLRENNEWVKLADMNEKRKGIGKNVAVFNEEIWVFGGHDGENTLKTVEKYNPQTNTWTMMPKMNHTKLSTAVSQVDGKLYVSGGNNGTVVSTSNIIESYDPKMNGWEIFCHMPFALYGHSSIVEGTNLIIIGGRKSNGQPSDEVWKIDVFDPKKQWVKMQNLQCGRFGHGSVKLIDGLMVIGGAINEKNYLSSMEMFNGQKWIQESRLPETRLGFSLVPLTARNEETFLQRL